jgi:hypothetical protein
MAGKGVLKKLTLVFGIGVLIIVGAGIYVYKNLSSFAKTGTEKALEYVLQVDVSIGDMEILPTKGSVEIGNLRIGNPDGFKTSEAFALERIYVRADIKSFMGDKPVVEEIAIKGSQITLEQGLKGSNLGQLVKNAESLSSGEGAAPKGDAEAKKQAGKQIIIRRVTLEDSDVSVSAPILKGEKKSFPLPGIEIKNIGDDNNPVTVAVAMQRVLSRITQEAIMSGGNLIPADLTKSLEGALGSIGGGEGAAVEQVQKKADEVKDKIKEVGGNLGGLLKKK